jgi:hypothetical protein
MFRLIDTETTENCWLANSSPPKSALIVTLLAALLAWTPLTVRFRVWGLLIVVDVVPSAKVADPVPLLVASVIVTG